MPRKPRLSDRPLFSYRDDASVPEFDDAGPRTVMDAHCALCARGAKWIAKNDSEARFKIIPLQSELGRALMTHYGVDPDDPASWLFLDDGAAYSSLGALMRVGQRLGGIWRGLSVLKILPPAVQTLLYNFVARNRYRFFGRAGLCAMPDKDVQERLIQ